MARRRSERLVLQCAQQCVRPYARHSVQQSLHRRAHQTVPWFAALLLLLCAPARGMLAQARGSGAGNSSSGGLNPVTTISDTTDPLGIALTAEEKGELKRAASAYREVLQRALMPGASQGDRVELSLLGLERVWADMGVRDSILPVVQRVVMLRPADPVARGIQLRTLVNLGRDEEARLAFSSWRRAAGNDGAPFREYSRLLLAAGRAQAADSVLGVAGRLLGAGGMISGEVAQLHVALGRWDAAAVAFRESLASQPYLETAALFALQRAPIATRDSIREVLSAPPVSLRPRRLLSSLELAWGEPRRAWTALSSVRADDSTTAAWRSFGEETEFMQTWPVARDAWVAIFERRGDLEAQQHAAQAALSAGDASLALNLATRPAPPATAANPLARPAGKGDAVKLDPTRDAATRLRTLLPIEIAALGELGRAKDAQARLDASMSQLDEPARAAMARPLVTAWLRAGDVERARAAVKGSDLAEDDETAGWLALYEGDLATARKRLVRADTKRGPLVDALGLLARTRVQKSPSLGLAFLALAQRDSAAASARFVALADSLGEAAPVLLSLASRIEAAKTIKAANGKRPVSPSALVLWDRIVAQYPKSPEAPEALLASARAFRDAGDNPTAVTRFESLLIDYPESALLPQARRDLERLRGQVPPELTAR